MSETAELLLGVIAVAVAVMAVVQVGAIVAGLRARPAGRAAGDRDRNGLKPVLVTISPRSAPKPRARRPSAAGQVERFDRLFTDLTSRIDQTVGGGAAYRFGPGPRRNGHRGRVRAAMSALQGMREATRRRSATRAASFEEEEESLFIG